MEIFPPGAYEIEQINDEISRQLQVEAQPLGKTAVVLEANTATLHSIVHLIFGFKIDFSLSGTLRDLLGFDSVILSEPYNYSKNKVNIMISTDFTFALTVILVLCEMDTPQTFYSP